MGNLGHLVKFRPNDLLVKEFENWVVCVRAKQVTLGSCVILLKREEPSLGRLTASEAYGLVEAAKWFESITRATFSAEKFNYIAAMMKDPFVHFHAFPRYAGAREAVGEVWQDEYWPKAVTLADVQTSEAVLSALVAKLQNAE